jgi:hypothetical protein
VHNAFKSLYPFSKQTIDFSVTLDMSQPFQLFQAEWESKLKMAKLLYEQYGALQMFMREQTPQEEQGFKLLVGTGVMPRRP